MSLMRQPNIICRWEPTELASTILSASSRQVIRAWISSREFLDDQHDPVMLTTDSHGEPSFGKLVRNTNPELAPAVVLNELLRKGVVESLESGHLLLRRSVYAPSQPRLQTGARLNSLFSSDGEMSRRRFDDAI